MRSTGTRSFAARSRARERGVERGERHLVDAQRAVERVLAHRLDDGPAPGDEPGLRAAEELVAAEGHGVGPALQGLESRRLGGEPPGEGLEEAAALSSTRGIPPPARARPAPRPTAAR